VKKLCVTLWAIIRFNISSDYNKFQIIIIFYILYKKMAKTNTNQKNSKSIKTENNTTNKKENDKEFVSEKDNCKNETWCFLCDSISKKPIIYISIVSILILIIILSNLLNMSNKIQNDYMLEGIEPNDCIMAIKEYHENSNKKTTWKPANTWDTVVVDYIWRFTSWEVFDTSVRSIAEKCGKYNPNRNYNEWLEFVIWNGQVVPGFDKAPLGMKVWQTKTVKLSPSEWYGEKSESNYQFFPKEQLPPKQDGTNEYKKWEKLFTSMWEIEIIDVNNSWVILNLNHPMAGKELIFDITIKNIK